MPDYRGVTWRVNYGEIAERDQFRVGYVNQESYDGYFELSSLADLIGVLNAVVGLNINQIARGAALQARKVSDGLITSVRIEPRLDTGDPARIMQLKLVDLTDLLYALGLFQADLPNLPFPDDWDFSELLPVAVLGKDGKLPESTIPERLSSENLDAVYGGPVSVKDPRFGAVGDGAVDDTLAFRAAAVFVRDAGGGTITVPDGIYLVDPAAATDVGIWVNDGGFELFSNTRLQMSPGAVIKAKANSKSVYKIIRVYDSENVEIVGGTIIGDRDTHTGVTGEWGYGISIMGSRHVTVRDVTVTDCWGDGVNVQRLTATGFGIDEASVDIKIDRVTSLRNRRQGFSIESGVDVAVTNCEGSYTNGAAPSAGIDIEPPTDQGIIQNVRITNFTAKGNAGRGIAIHTWEQTDTIIVDGAWLDGNGHTRVLDQLHSSCYGTNLVFRNITTRNTLAGQASVGEEGTKSGFTLEGSNLDAPVYLTGGFGGTWSLDYTIRNCKIVGGVKASRARFLRFEDLDIELSGTQIGIDLTYAGAIDTQFPMIVRCKVMNGKNAVLAGNGTMGTESLEIDRCQFFDQTDPAVVLKGSNAVIEGTSFRGYANTTGTAAVTRVSGVDIPAARIRANRFNRAKWAGAAATNTPAYALDLGSTTLYGGRIDGNLIAAGVLMPGGAMGSGQITQSASVPSGSTANRPLPNVEDMLYRDSTLNKLLMVGGGVWRDAMGTAV